MKVVSDSGPILSFARAGRLDLLRQVMSEISVPQAVFDEIVVAGRGKPGAIEVETAGWVKLEPLQNLDALDQISRKLNRGEAQAIALSRGLNAALLIDEYAGRKEAERLGIEHFGTLRVLKEAKDRGVIKEIKPVLDELIASGTYISDSLYEEFLHFCGESIVG
jgi:predicted nucleic acid-binding protein